MQGTRVQFLGVQSLVKELRSHVLCSETKKKEKKRCHSLITPESSQKVPSCPFAVKPPTESPTHPSAKAFCHCKRVLTFLAFCMGVIECVDFFV